MPGSVPVVCSVLSRMLNEMLHYTMNYLLDLGCGKLGRTASSEPSDSMNEYVQLLNRAASWFWSFVLEP